MINKDSIAVIPARGGSKRIPRKNIQLINGKPVIAHAIELALGLNIFSDVIVSTDDLEIANISESFGASVPFIRSAELSGDFSTTMEVMADAINRVSLSTIEFICCIYPVTPLLTKQILYQAYNLIKNSDWDYVFPACAYETPLERAFRKDTSGKVLYLKPEYVDTRTQDMEQSYFDAGQFYFGRKEAWKNNKPILNGNSTFIEFDQNHFVDVDNPKDWEKLVKLIEK